MAIARSGWNAGARPVKVKSVLPANRFGNGDILSFHTSFDLFSSIRSQHTQAGQKGSPRQSLRGPGTFRIRIPVINEKQVQKHLENIKSSKDQKALEDLINSLPSEFFVFHPQLLPTMFEACIATEDSSALLRIRKKCKLNLVSYLEQLKQRRILPDASLYGAVIETHVANGKADAFGCFQDMVRSGIKPTTQHYNILLDFFHPSIDETLNVFNKMKSDGVPVDHVTLSKILNQCRHHKDLQHFEQIWTEFRDIHKIQPGFAAYELKLKLLIDISDWQGLARTIQESHNNQISIEPRLMTVILKAFSKINDTQHPQLAAIQQAASTLVASKDPKQLSSQFWQIFNVSEAQH